MLRDPASDGELKRATELTPRQQIFIREYLTDLNATKAAERAGYNRRTANEQGARLRFPLLHTPDCGGITNSPAALH